MSADAAVGGAGGIDLHRLAHFKGGERANREGLVFSFILCITTSAFLVAIHLAHILDILGRHVNVSINSISNVRSCLH